MLPLVDALSLVEELSLVAALSLVDELVELASEAGAELELDEELVGLSAVPASARRIVPELELDVESVLWFVVELALLEVSLALPELVL